VRPFHAPFKGRVAALAELGREAVLGFSFHTSITWLSLRGNYAVYSHNSKLHLCVSLLSFLGEYQFTLRLA
jgi:hypothetical protein